MESSVAEMIERLPGMSTEELKREWQRVHGSSAPGGLSRDLLQRAIAWRIQERRLGGPDKALQRQLLASSDQPGKTPRSPASVEPRPGTRLYREWRGIVHQVDATEAGYLYREVRYKTLSEVARVITGTRWSGPLFFGLRKARAEVASHENAG
jgi:hypothetical protein